MTLDILLRTCNRSENNPTMKRIVTVDRDELILRGLRSLITSINTVPEEMRSSIKLTIIDDSTPEFQKKLFKLASTCLCKKNFIRVHLDNNASMKYCYEYAMGHFHDVIYFAEDDYLYFPSCIQEMVEEYENFTLNLGGNFVAIHPADSPLEYFPKEIREARIVLGSHRHWRTSVSSPFSLMLPKKAFVKHYQKFMDYSKFDGVIYQEASTINHMFVEGVFLFTPIPTLAFHLGYLYPPAPHAQHEELWEENASH